MSELRMVGASRTRAAGPDRGLQGLERRRSGRDPRGGLSRARLERRAVRGHRSGGIRRLPGEQAARLARRGDDAQDRLARERLLPRSRPRLRPDVGAAARRRAEPALEDVLEARARPRARARRRARRSRSARCSPTCRTRAPRPSPARRATPSSSRASGSSTRATRVRPGSSACSRTPAGGEGIPAASLWAAVPHYVSLAPSPRAARALCDRLAQLLSVTIDTAELAEAEEAYAEQVTEAVSTDEETAAYVPSSSAAPTSWTSRSTRRCRRATRSPPS